MPKKILIINTTFENGGAAAVARSIFNELNTSEYDARFAYGRGGKSPQAKTYKFGNFIETLTHAFFVRVLGLEGYGSYWSTKKLINYIEKEKFDLVHLHNLHGYYLNIYNLMDYLNKSGIPIIWTMHDEWALNPLKAHTVNNYSYPKTYNNLFLNFLFKKKIKLFGNTSNLTIVCPSEWQIEKLKNSYLKNHRIELIHNGVNIDLFKPIQNKILSREKYNLPTNRKIVIFSAADLRDENKGARYIFEASKKLEDIFFLGVGKGDSYKKENIRAVGYIDNKEELAELYGLSDLLCVTSLAETQPLVVLEAMASGLPIVGFDIPGVKDIINENMGSIVPAGNTNKLTEAIISDINDFKKGQNARELAVKNYSQTEFYKNYKKLYEEILK